MKLNILILLNKIAAAMFGGTPTVRDIYNFAKKSATNYKVVVDIPMNMVYS